MLHQPVFFGGKNPYLCFNGMRGFNIYQKSMCVRLAFAYGIAIFSSIGVALTVEIFRSLDFIYTGALSIAEILQLIVLLMPLAAHYGHPIGVGLAIGYEYSQALENSELKALSAAGMSTTGIASPAIAFGLVATLVGGVIGFGLLPLSQQGLVLLEKSILADFRYQALQPGESNRANAEAVIYFQDWSSDTSIRNVLLYFPSKTGRDRLMVAQSGDFIKSSRGVSLELRDGIMFNGAENRAEQTQVSYDRFSIALRAAELPSVQKHNLIFTFYVSDILDASNTANLSDHIGEQHLINEGHRRVIFSLFGLVQSLVPIIVIYMIAGSNMNNNYVFAISAGVTLVYFELFNISFSYLQIHANEYASFLYVFVFIPIALAGLGLLAPMRGRWRWNNKPGGRLEIPPQIGGDLIH